MNRKYLWFAVVFLSVAVLDVLTKQWILWTLDYRDGYAVTSFFNIVHVRNPGAAFGLLANADESVRIPFFIATSLIAMGVITYMVVKAPKQQLWYVLGLGAILGGAIGNFIDRIRFGYVIDFLDVHAGGRHWPAFNVADIGITVGVAILLIDALFEGKRELQAGKQKKSGGQAL